MDLENTSQRRYNSPTDKNTSRTRKTSTTKCRGGWGETLYNNMPATQIDYNWQPLGYWGCGGANPATKMVSSG